MGEPSLLLLKGMIPNRASGRKVCVGVSDVVQVVVNVREVREGKPAAENFYCVWGFPAWKRWRNIAQVLFQIWKGFGANGGETGSAWQLDLFVRRTEGLGGGGGA